MSIPLNGVSYQDFKNYMNSTKKPSKGFCLQCGKESKREVCSKPCFYKYFGGTEQSNPFNTAREQHNKDQVTVAIKHLWR